MSDTNLPKAANLDNKDATREELTKIENAVLQALDQISGDQRWISIARTHIQIGFMSAKRGLYEGKRVGDA
jgi:hypothetical protein